MNQVSQLSGIEWQRWANQLLHRRYGAGEYQEVPDNDKGDAGIEGFTIKDGHAYQVYGPEEPLSTDVRYRRLRDKMTEDIEKFVVNQAKLKLLFGATKIRRWILFVPRFDSKKIVAHATDKTAAVLEAGLSYVDVRDFRVMIVNEDSFSVERQQLIMHAVRSISVEIDAASDVDIETWSEDDENSVLISNLDIKILKLPAVDTPIKRIQFRRDVIRYLLDGQSVLEALRSYPDIWAEIRSIKSERERYLSTLCVSSGEAAGAILHEALEQIKAGVQAKVSALSTSDADAVAHEAMADWLMRCPLDFPEVKHNE